MMSIVNSRLIKWTEENNVLNEYQADFRKGYSTVDNVFNLASLVNLHFAEKKKLYV